MTYHTAVRPLTDEEYALLKEDIAKRGIITPVIIDVAGNIVDGFHRCKIAQELGISPIPSKQVDGTEAELRAMAIALNVARRQLTAEDRQELVAQLRAEGKSTREISSAIGVDPRTVRRDLAASGGANAPGDRVTGADGKSYPARRPTQESVEQPEADPEPDNVISVDFEAKRLPPTITNTPAERVGGVLGSYDNLRIQGDTDPVEFAKRVIEEVTQESGKWFYRGQYYTVRELVQQQGPEAADKLANNLIARGAGLLKSGREIRQIARKFGGQQLLAAE